MVMEVWKMAMAMKSMNGQGDIAKDEEKQRGNFEENKVY
jgi:hypothetical protein